MQSKLVIEESKNGKKTCKYNINGKWKYLYSKYDPKHNLEDIVIDKDASCIIMLGLGLGYELEYLKSITNKTIYIIESDLEFYDELKSNELLFTNTKVLGEENYQDILNNSSNPQVIKNMNLMQCDIPFYLNLINILKNNIPKRKTKICVFEHITIANDCMEALVNIGYETEKVQWTNELDILKNVLKINPDILFTINFSPIIAQISESFKIPYISWTVDTPAYTLYEKENSTYSYSYMFIYDEKVVLDLQKKGIRNTHYMPVAANVNRLRKVKFEIADSQKYCSDVSFLGSSCIENEYLSFFKHRISNATRNEIEQMIELQDKVDSYLLKKITTNKLVEKVEEESKLTIDRLQHELLPKNEKLSFLLGRYHSYKERLMIIEELARSFNMKVYGDKGWVSERETYNYIYQGNAEHFNEMPKVFIGSKINLNITRSFVESGLPMRVFDVLGCTGFLLTNNKKDIQRLFTVGSDLVVYRDLQDMKEIIEYYLVHEEERNKIRSQGFETVEKYHSYEIRLKSIMNIVSNSAGF